MMMPKKWQSNAIAAADGEAAWSGASVVMPSAHSAPQVSPQVMDSLSRVQLCVSASAVMTLMVGQAISLTPTKIVTLPNSSISQAMVVDHFIVDPTPPALAVLKEVSAETAESIHDRLRVLREIAIEDSITWNGSAEKQLWDFLNSLQSPSRPAIGIDSSGDFRIVWENMLREQVAVRFKGTDQLEAVLFQKTEHGFRREAISAPSPDVLKLVFDMKLVHVTRG
ncbi:MAG: hypothetical protein ACRYHC_15470 [Janthinobacterium lividum]